MKVRYAGEKQGISLLPGNVYECLGVVDGGEFGVMFRVIDEEGEAIYVEGDPPGYLYPASKELWEIVEDNDEGLLARTLY